MFATKSCAEIEIQQASAGLSQEGLRLSPLFRLQPLVMRRLVSHGGNRRGSRPDPLR